jgi:hypothetical protein
VIVGAVGTLALGRPAAAAERFVVVNAHHTN